MAEIIASEDAEYALEIVKTICTEVGPGLPGSSQERERAAIIEKELASHLGAGNVSVEEFTLAPGAYLSLFPGLFMLVAVLLNISIGRVTGLSPWISGIAALAFSILSPLIFILQFLLGLEAIDPLLRKKKSENVIGRLLSPGTEDIKRLLIISGHHDSAPENNVLVLLNSINRLLRRGGRRDSAGENSRLRLLGYVFYFLSGTFFLGFIALLAMSIIQVAGVVTGNTGMVRGGTLGWGLLVYPMAPAILYGCFAIGGKENGGKVPGAMDNLSASALVVAMGRFLAKNPSYIPADTEIRLISFGSEEAGLRGSRRYVERHLDELKRLEARLLNIEMVAHPEIAILTLETSGTVKNSPEMVKNVAAAAERAGVPYRVQQFAGIGAGTDAAPFSKAGLKATTLLPFQESQQLVGFYHQRWDRPEVLTVEPLFNVLRLAFEWVRRGGEQVKQS